MKYYKVTTPKNVIIKKSNCILCSCLFNVLIVLQIAKELFMLRKRFESSESLKQMH